MLLSNSERQMPSWIWYIYSKNYTAVSAKCAHILKKQFENCKSCVRLDGYIMSDLALKLETINKEIDIDGECGPDIIADREYKYLGL